MDPRIEYEKRLETHLATIAAKERLHIRIGNSNLAIVVAGLVLAWLVIAKHLFTPYWLAVPAALYLILAIFHERILRDRACAQTSAGLYRKGIARIEDRWTGTGQPGDRFRDAKHVYADDLDLFGRGCLFELLSTARLPMGENRLAEWLRFPSTQTAILERQGLITELRERLDLREDLAVTGEALVARLNPESLIGWAETPSILAKGALRAVTTALAICTVGACAYLFATSVYWPLFLVLALDLFFYLTWQQRAEEVVSGLASNAEGLLLFSEILKRLETEPFASPRLQGFSANLTQDKKPASGAIRSLAGILYWIDARGSLIAQLSNLPLLYTLQVGFAAEAWRRRWGSRMRAWVEIVGEMEALLSLATYSFEHPADPFPEFVSSEDSRAYFSGEELGHPLIPAPQCVRNSVLLDKNTQMLLVSGSNMSGKSTLLRTVGINTVLALAGAPVRAKSLRLTALSLGTSIRGADSLQEGRSNFYTEILHIRQVFDLSSGAAPLLFLFDELLEGTNSRDRRIGAEGVIRALLERGAIGLVTTHDLALTEITHALGGSMRNMHFQDHVENGKMIFDYKLQEGVVTKSNALELMRLIGLEL